jgi:hypothetical protein
MVSIRGSNLHYLFAILKRTMPPMNPPKNRHGRVVRFADTPIISPEIKEEKKLEEKKDEPRRKSSNIPINARGRSRGK